MALAFYFTLFLIANLLNPILPLKWGKETGSERFKFIVQIYDPQFVGVGSLINNRFVITAAHCFTSQTKLQSISVRAGELKIVNQFKGGYKVLAILRHPKYSSQELGHDIALLRLKSPIAATTRIGYTSICPSKLRADENAVALTAGWNILKPSDLMQTLDIKIISPRKCIKSFPQLPRGTICGTTEFTHSRHDAIHDLKNSSSLCYGDSGDPLLYNNQICAITIAFHRCGWIKHPNIYTDLHFHHKFISHAISKLDFQAKEMAKKRG
ncbi:anionic trypsin-1 [Drosophila willistoni]|uniref:anionic trypsin-1 n=1 Tax=Drosophila willistoni TaxID=7260 RepID=UPI00017D8F95|nr:anionic trypsin-1 [Drosophila willistoni]